MKFEGRVWSMTKAIESGRGSTLKTRSVLAGVVFVDREVAPGEAGNLVAL